MHHEEFDLLTHPEIFIEIITTYHLNEFIGSGVISFSIIALGSKMIDHHFKLIDHANPHLFL